MSNLVGLKIKEDFIGNLYVEVPVENTDGSVRYEIVYLMETDAL